MRDAEPATELIALSREQERLTARLAALAEARAHADSPPVTPALVRSILAVRLGWPDQFGADLGEPARNMLLGLYAAQLEGLSLPPAGLAAAAAVPVLIALRWIDTMERRGLLLRERQPDGDRPDLLALSPEAVAGIEAYIAAEAYIATIFRRSAPLLWYRSYAPLCHGVRIRSKPDTISDIRYSIFEFCI